jgi:hypothetical protein
MENIHVNIEAGIEFVACDASEELPVLNDLQLLLIGGGCGETVFD